MTLANETSHITYIGDGKTVDFPIPFRFFANEIAVYHNKTTKKYQTPTDYVIVKETPSESHIHFTVAPAQGIYVTILREVALRQQITFIEGENFPAADYENGLDHIYMALQELNERLNRAFIAAPGTSDITENFYSKAEIRTLLDNHYTKQQTAAVLTSYYSKTEADSVFCTKVEIRTLLQSVEKQLSEI